MARASIRCLVLVALFASPGAATAQDGESPDVCTDGVISAIELDRRPIYDPDATGFAPLAWTYRFMNVLHITTAESFVRRELLFEEGDCFDPLLVSESARLLDQYDFLAYATAVEEDDDNGGKRIVVETRDEWSTQVDIGATYEGGPNLERLQITEENFLGQGIFGEFTHRSRREIDTQLFRVATPRFFGRTDVSIGGGRSRPGHVFGQYIRYPFVGETGSYAFRQGFDRSTDFFSYSTDGAETFSQLLVPAYRELLELSFARRLGEPTRSLIAGVSFTRDVLDFRRTPEVTVGDDFNDLEPLVGPPIPGVQRQLVPTASTRVALHLGTRRYRYAPYVGLDGVRERQTVSLGVFAGVTLGRGFDVFIPSGVQGLDDTFARAYGSFGAALGSSLLHGSVTAESRRADGEWLDVLVDADLVSYLRSDAFRSHTLFLRVATAGGWDTTLPYQLSLGGREGVRSLVEDRYPGGKMVRFTIEDRVALAWPSPEAADFGLTFFSDIGRVWAGDAPYGVDSGWQAGVGFGLRIGVPSGTRSVVRTDIVFPVGQTGGDPIFRVNFELNRLRAGFFSADVLRSRRLNLGPEHF